MRIAVDLMGGDNAPEAIFRGAMNAAREHPAWEYLLVGTHEALDRRQELPENATLVYCNSVMAMDEDVRGLMKKRDSSIWIATELVKKGEADAIVSAGSTAAQMACATLLLGRVPHVERPAIGTIIPTLEGGRFLLDVGANVDCGEQQLVQFARMGEIYSRLIQGVERPRVGLLVNGTEPHKGNNASRAAYALLQDSGLNFIGNLEGRDILTGGYDVLVCDGMSGNVAIKCIEGTTSALMKLIKQELTASPKRALGAALVKDGFTSIKARFDYEEYGGAPLLGVKGVSIVCHGSSGPRAIHQALELAASCFDSGLIEALTKELDREEVKGDA
ncbi:MAG: phosphate acyltransferase PlsX [Firmicutes bacterium]|nr:phosphate acyltransferase PlsX [Bacillota bacterium]